MTSLTVLPYCSLEKSASVRAVDIRNHRAMSVADVLPENGRYITSETPSKQVRKPYYLFGLDVPAHVKENT